jgi:hypothetical protein
VAALDDRITETVTRLLESLRGRLESELGSSRDELIRAAHDANAEAAVEAAANATAVARQQAEQQLTELRETADRSTDELQARHREEIEALQHRLNEAHEYARQQSEEHQQQLEERQQQIEDSQKEIAAARVQIEALTAELDEARKQLDVMRDDVEATLLDIEASRRESEAARVEVNRLASQVRNNDERVAQARRLPAAVRALDEATTCGDVLERLAIRAGCEAGRAAVFLVKGNTLRDWRTVGFDFLSDSSRLEIDVSASGPMAEAVRTGEGVSPCAQNFVPEFARTDEAREAAAWPVTVGGAVVAVLYADGPVADKLGEPYWPAFLDVLARHAGRVLEAITVVQAAGLLTGKATGHASSSVGGQSSGSIQ